MMSIRILDDCRYYEAELRAFVVMTHHIHLVVRPRDDQTISQFMERLKTNSSKELYPLLFPSELAQLTEQSGLNKRKFWMYRFRANPLYTEDVLVQKVQYTHLNPCRAQFCEIPEDYKWSSVRLLELGMNNEFGQIDLGAALEYYRRES